MASLRNLVIAILRLRGWRNLAAALRRNARDATRVLPLLGITSPCNGTISTHAAAPLGRLINDHPTPSCMGCFECP
jgi:hypothetical protein